MKSSKIGEFACIHRKQARVNSGPFLRWFIGLKFSRSFPTVSPVEKKRRDQILLTCHIGY